MTSGEIKQIMNAIFSIRCFDDSLSNVLKLQMINELANQIKTSIVYNIKEDEECVK